MAMAKADPEREERRREQKRIADSLKSSGALDEIFARIDANYRTDIFGGLTPTASLTYTGKRAVGSRPLAALDGRQLMVPGVATLDLGLRQQFKLGKIPASFRALLYNVFDEATWKALKEEWARRWAA